VALSDLDGAAVVRGAAVGALLIVPAAVVSQVLADDSSTEDGTPPIVFVFFALIIAGFVLAGWVAGTRPTSERTPVQHGAAAAALAFLAVQAVGAVFVVASGESVAPLSIIANLLFAASCGAVGGLLAARTITRRLGGRP